VVCVVLLIKGKGMQVCVLHMPSPVVLQPSSNPILLIRVCRTCGRSATHIATAHPRPWVYSCYGHVCQIQRTQPSVRCNMIPTAHPRSQKADTDPCIRPQLWGSELGQVIAAVQASVEGDAAVCG
jgi:hypothetical protein